LVAGIADDGLYLVSRTHIPVKPAWDLAWLPDCPEDLRAARSRGICFPSFARPMGCHGPGEGGRHAHPLHKVVIGGTLHGVNGARARLKLPLVLQRLRVCSRQQFAQS
jgi:hypothetical protein